MTPYQPGCAALIPWPGWSQAEHPSSQDASAVCKNCDGTNPQLVNPPCPTTGNLDMPNSTCRPCQHLGVDIFQRLCQPFVYTENAVVLFVPSGLVCVCFGGFEGLGFILFGFWFFLESCQLGKILYWT